MNEISVYEDRQFITTLEKAIERNDYIYNWDLFQLAYQYKQTTLIDDFTTLQSLQHLTNLEFMEHQINAAKNVIENMNGRAILADEVGLGKTIEAGLILKEYMIRGLVKNVLILAPASLIKQWINELQNKFYIPVVNYRKNYAWNDYPIIISSLDLAKRKEHRDNITNIDFDMVIIDEAHRLKNAHTINYEFVQMLKKKYCLLLTATPIQNNVLEIFNLISILKPGYLGDRRSFIKQYGKKHENATNHPYLQQLIKQVMIRNRRKDTILNNIKRNVHTIWLQFTEEEARVYNEIDSVFSKQSSLTKITYLKELCSSREACYLSLQQSTNKNLSTIQSKLLHAIASLPHHSKAKKLIEVIQNIGNEKIIIFTEYRATQVYLQWYLHQYDITAVLFQGGMNKNRKEWMTQLFSQHIQVLIATEAGGEGINLQFCHHIINYDLPWNPMRLEQRIGRVHRFGQNNQIKIYNFAIKDTIEAHIVTLLYEKLGIFENVIGKLDKILTKLNIDDMEDDMKKIMGETKSIGELKIKMDNFATVVSGMLQETEEEQNG